MRYVFGILISVIFCVAGVYFSIADSIGNIGQYYKPIIFMMISFFISAFSLFVFDKLAVQDLIASELRGVVGEINRNMTSGGVLRRFDNADLAMSHLLESLPKAKECWNTRISVIEGGVDRNASGKFEVGLVKCLKNGLVYNDVVSRNALDYAKRVSRGSSYKGRYNVRCATSELPFTNFIVLKFDNDDYEVFFGWPVSHISGSERHVFLSRDRRLVDYYIMYHGIVSEYSEKVIFE